MQESGALYQPAQPDALVSPLIFFFSILDLIFFHLKIEKETKVKNPKTISIFNANFNTSNMTWSLHEIKKDCNK